MTYLLSLVNCQLNVEHREGPRVQDVAKRRILGLRERKEGKRLHNEQVDNFCSSPSVIEKSGKMTGWITE
jgi:hypothetical protein